MDDARIEKIESANDKIARNLGTTNGILRFNCLVRRVNPSSAARDILKVEEVTLDWPALRQDIKDLNGSIEKAELDWGVLVAMFSARLNLTATPLSNPRVRVNYTWDMFLKYLLNTMSVEDEQIPDIASNDRLKKIFPEHKQKQQAKVGLAQEMIRVLGISEEHELAQLLRKVEARELGKQASEPGSSQSGNWWPNDQRVLRFDGHVLKEDSDIYEKRIVAQRCSLNLGLVKNAVDKFEISQKGLVGHSPLTWRQLMIALSRGLDTNQTAQRYGAEETALACFMMDISQDPHGELPELIRGSNPPYESSILYDAEEGLAQAICNKLKLADTHPFAQLLVAAESHALKGREMDDGEDDSLPDDNLPSLEHLPSPDIEKLGSTGSGALAIDKAKEIVWDYQFHGGKQPDGRTIKGDNPFDVIRKAAKMGRLHAAGRLMLE